ncbi:rhomboid-domain-containing protein [Hymenopellis radicata]|nr:rhomboid-domain-containing protein [Hymenopellis radicata]
MRSRSTSPYPGDIKHNAYTDDDYYNHTQPDESQSSLVRNAADVGRSGNNYEDLEYADPYNNTRAPPVPEKSGPLAKLLGGGGAGRYPLEQRIEDKKRGIGRQRHPFLVWILTTIMVSVFIYELVVNSREQGSPVSFKPVVNYMLGPASAVLINVGARFPACMKLVDDIPPTFQLGCMNNTANPVDSDKICTVEDICGFGGFHDADPNQWYRFILPIFIHAGFIHIALNMLAQLTLSAQIEREMGSGGFFFTYFAAGIFGNVFGGNFSLVGVPSVGASGAIFGTVAVTWVDLIAHWKYQYRPVRKLIFMIIELCIGIAIGYIPYVDNFAHIGGFLMGLLVGTVFYPVISETKRHKMITWGFRIVAIPLAIILFVVLTRNFYTADPYAACDWCRYLSCWPTASNDHCHGTGLTTSTS